MSKKSGFRKGDIMTIRQLKSGNWNIREMVNRKVYSLTIDHKPTQKEAQRLMMRKIAEDDDQASPSDSFSKMARAYINSVEGSLSPSTIREYTRLLNTLERLYGRFCALRGVSSQDVQRVISDYAKGKDENAHQKITHRSPKTVSNMYGFIRSVLRFSDPSVALRVVLPDRQKTEPYIPTDEEVKAVCEALRGSKYEAAIILASLGLRRSEIAGLSIDDVSETSVFIHQVKVQDKGGSWIIKDHGKTAASTREIEIPVYLSELIHKQGYVYSGSPGQLTVRLHTIQDRLGIPRFSVHKLRHFYASSALSLNIPMHYVQRAGGWSTPATLQKIYTHTQRDKQKRIDRIAMEQIASLTVPNRS